MITAQFAKNRNQTLGSMQALMLGSLMGLPIFVGCQNNPWATSLPVAGMANAKPNYAAHRTTHDNSISEVNPTAAQSSSLPHGNQVSSQVVQTSYSNPVGTGMISDAPQAGPYPAVPMAILPGQTPVSMNAYTGGSCGCSSCSGNTGVYQPVYANGDFSSCGCSSEVTCGPTNNFGGVDPQEYIYDGGDQSPVVRIRNDYSLVGLGPEDTVVQFTTEDGREFAETGCRTAIYAPRFASIRRITSYQRSEGVLAARAALRDQPLVHMHAPVPPTQVKERQVAVRDSNVNVIEAFRERNRGVPVQQNQGPKGWTNAFRPYEDLQIIRTGVAERDERIELIKYATNAIAWSTVDELMVFVDNKQTSIVESEDHPQELLTYELGGARIRLCKVASQQSANVGEVVDFTIRFDNIAEQTLSDLVIHDSLPPRLEYVEDSQQSSIAASFSTEPNEVGSKVLKWKLEKPLKTGEGGIVRFQCRVR